MFQGINVAQDTRIASIYVHYLCKCTNSYCICIGCRIILQLTLISFLTLTSQKPNNCEVIAAAIAVPTVTPLSITHKWSDIYFKNIPYSSTISIIGNSIKEGLHTLVLKILREIFHKRVGLRSFYIWTFALASMVKRSMVPSKLQSEIMRLFIKEGLDQCNSRIWLKSSPLCWWSK